MVCAMIHYAGIGSRQTPVEVLPRMTAIAQLLAMRGFVLRSGGARGADTAFETGAGNNRLRWIALNAERNPAWFNHARKYHPKWKTLDRTAQQLHARNSAIMLNDGLDDPVKFVACWTPDAAIRGGTGQALRIAADYSIPVFNLCDDSAEAALWQFVGGLS
jgi:hypothetical protein